VKPREFIMFFDRIKSFVAGSPGDPISPLHDLYLDLSRPIWRLYWSTRWRFFRQSFQRCDRCEEAAQWSEGSSTPGRYYCDTCVPRGCDCNIKDRSIPSKLVFDPPNALGEQLIWVDYGDLEPEQYRDEKGRLLPCCDFLYFRWGYSRQTTATRSS
jgi:hypothetical protein